jgi:hypothetical protein
MSKFTAASYIYLTKLSREVLIEMGGSPVKEVCAFGDCDQAEGYGVITVEKITRHVRASRRGSRHVSSPSRIISITFILLIPCSGYVGNMSKLCNVGLNTKLVV